MKIIRQIKGVRRFLATAPRPVVLVPTMGALHEGHLSLIRRGRKAAGGEGTVAVSIFVNPTQFGPKEDLSRYPRPFERDAQLCREEGVDLIFAPEPEEMYHRDKSVYVDEEGLSQALCGRSRPGHFRGVCTVVAKLFNIIQPQAAVFGLKDFQQFAIISRMVRDLDFPVKLLPEPIYREKDGLALSSRNVYLTAEERQQAPILQQALAVAAAAVKKGHTDAERLRRQIESHIQEAPAARIDYIEIVDAESLQPLKKVRANTLIALAVFFGRTRLIDNHWVR